ncbi:DUF2169 family type VI secretion system accessory protein [Chitinimonas lacunae]|uniref:DUF2169 domain-containing protein n=1 Tax=Chitinimonas lacunae TaxID=1963018 RepID=A0ABV8MWI1_9NEIS
MQVVIGSRHLAVQTFPALDVSGREHLVVAAKATWQIPEPGQRPLPLPPQELLPVDRFVGEPGLSAPLYGCDLLRFKPRCDVLFDACAHAPGQQPVRELVVGFRLGSLKKLLNVHGPRVWRRRLGGYSLSRGEPFVSMPLHYGMAFGGTRAWQQGDTTLSEALLANPSGIGWAGPHTLEQLDGAPAPSLEAVHEPVERPDGRHAPIALSAIGRHWPPRLAYAGTYDEHWQREIFPFLPEDFDERFHQCAPEDQQIDYPRGGEEVVLLNLLKGRSEVRFRLPNLTAVPVRVLRTDYTTEKIFPPVDTLFFETEENRFSAVWRVSLPIQRRLQEIDTVAVGQIDPHWWNEKTVGSVGCATCGETVRLPKL